MNILEFSKPLNPNNSNRILPKISTKAKNGNKQNQKTESDSIVLKSTYEEVNLMLIHLASKSQRLKSYLIQKGVKQQKAIDQFYDRNFFGSICLKALLKSILDKMYHQKRMGKGLKGLNKSLQVEIQNGIWNVIQRQVTLYKLDLQYTTATKQLKQQLNQRKRILQESLKKVEQNQLQEIINQQSQ